MDMTLFVPRELHLPLKELRTKFDDWVLLHSQTESAPPQVSLNPKSLPLLAEIPLINEVALDFCRNGGVDAQARMRKLYALSAAFRDGAKAFMPSTETCTALEHVDLTLTWDDFHLPFSHLFVKLPDEWANSQQFTPMQDCSEGVIEDFKPIWGYVTKSGEHTISILVYGKDHTITIDLIQGMSKGETIEDALRAAFDSLERMRKKPEDTRMVDGMQRNFDTFQRIVRVILNSAILMTTVGHKWLDWLHPAERQRHVRLMRRKNPGDRERGLMFHAGDIFQVDLKTPINIYC